MQGVRIASFSYTQLDVYRLSSRRRLAFLAMNVGRQADGPQLCPTLPYHVAGYPTPSKILPWQATSTGYNNGKGGEIQDDTPLLPKAPLSND